MITIDSKLLGSQKALLLAESDGCSVFQFRNETGDGTMTCYEVFFGAMLSFNDFHMEHTSAGHKASDCIKCGKCDPGILFIKSIPVVVRALQLWGAFMDG